MSDTEYTKGFQNGRLYEQERIIVLANTLICYEHHKGCDHAGCYAMGNLIGYIKEYMKEATK
jgi:hypothetical protein